MKIQSKLGVTIGAGTDCGCNCFASIIKADDSFESLLYTENCDGFSIEWQLEDGGEFTTDQIGGTTYSLVGVVDPLRVKLTSADCCTKFSNVL